jgi:hypothetical protein
MLFFNETNLNINNFNLFNYYISNKYFFLLLYNLKLMTLNCGLLINVYEKIA